MSHISTFQTHFTYRFYLFNYKRQHFNADPCRSNYDVYFVMNVTIQLILNIYRDLLYTRTYVLVTDLNMKLIFIQVLGMEAHQEQLFVAPRSLARFMELIIWDILTYIAIMYVRLF